MDGSSFAAFAGTATVLVGGSLGILKVLVDRHLAALTRLEARAEANTDVQSRIAQALDVMRDHLIDLRRIGERSARDLARLLDHAQLSETASVPMPPPADLPRAATITGQHPAYREAPASPAAASEPRR